MYLTIKACDVEDIPKLYALHMESYKKLRDRNIESVHFNLIYGNYNEDYTARRANVDIGDSKHIFRIIDVNVDRLIESYKDNLGRITTEQELEILEELKLKYQCVFDGQ